MGVVWKWSGSMYGWQYKTRLICMHYRIWLTILALVHFGYLIITLVIDHNNFVDISFQKCFLRYLSPGLLRWSSLQIKLLMVNCEANFVSFGFKIVKRLRSRKYEPVILERTLGLVFGPCAALYTSFLTHCTPNKKAIWTIWWDLS